MPKTSEKNGKVQRGCMNIGPSPAEPNVGSACRDFCGLFPSRLRFSDDRILI